MGPWQSSGPSGARFGFQEVMQAAMETWVATLRLPARRLQDDGSGTSSARNQPGDGSKQNDLLILLRSCRGYGGRPMANVVGRPVVM
jgi:hypothetical protein